MLNKLETEVSLSEFVEDQSLTGLGSSAELHSVSMEFNTHVYAHTHARTHTETVVKIV